MQKKHKVMVFGEEGFQQLSLCSEEFTFQQMTLPCHGQTREKKKRETMERVRYYNDFSKRLEAVTSALPVSTLQICVSIVWRVYRGNVMDGPLRCKVVFNAPFS